MKPTTNAFPAAQGAGTRTAALRALKILLLVVAGIKLGLSAASIGPTQDPDPDGYVSCARFIQEHGSAGHFPRLPGYPLLIALVDHVGRAPVAIDMFRFHLGLLLLFAAAGVALLWRTLGYLTALGFLVLLAFNSYFVWAAMVMLADLPFAVVFCVWVGVGIRILRAPTRRPLDLALFATLALAAGAIHPSASLRALQLIGVTAGVLGLADLGRRQFGRRLDRRMALSLALLASFSWGAGQIITLLYDNARQPTAMASTIHSSLEWRRWWLNYRMLLCLPPAEPASALDLRIEEVKRQVARRQGYPVEWVVPPGPAPEFMDLLRQETVPLDAWKERMAAHPLRIIPAALRELRAKYFMTVKNLTPFLSFEKDKQWITQDYPRVSGSPRDSLFWSTGVNLSRMLPSDASARKVRSAAWREVFLMLFTAGLTLGGLWRLNRRFRDAGTILGLTLLLWPVILSTALPVETRYFLPLIPAVYAVQALLVADMMREAARRLMSVALGVDAGRDSTPSSAPGRPLESGVPAAGAPAAGSGTGITSYSPAIATARNYQAWTLAPFEQWISGDILEIGVGHGGFAGLLSQRGRYHGVDIDADLVSEARANHPQADLRCADITTADLPREFGKRFDSIICMNVIEHIDDDVGAVANLLRALKPGGVLCVLVPALPLLYNDMDRLAGHRRRYTTRTIGALCRKAGGTQGTIRYFNALGGAGWLINRWAGHSSLAGEGLAMQIRIFDRLIIPLARVLDPVFARLFGQSITVIVRSA